jgi:hypothetical protein
MAIPATVSRPRALLRGWGAREGGARGGDRLRRAAPGVLAGLCLGLLALGPGLRRGFVLSYDMIFVPREPFSAALPGLAPPRAVPSDLVIATASRVLPADIVQKLVLLSIFVLACSGMAALLEDRPLLARLASGVFYAWNPYVAERLIIGQWALLLGYAGLPWVLRAVLRRGPVQLVLALLPAIIGGFAAMTVTGLVLVPAAICTRSGRRAAVTLGVFAVGTLPWLIPSFLHPVYADPAGVAAFSSRADTPFGTVGSLLMLGGMWNAETVPKGYGGDASALWLAIAGAALAAFALAGWRHAGRTRHWDAAWLALSAGAVLGFVIASLGVTAAGRDVLRSATEAWPGFATFRDAQQYIAPLAVAEAAGVAAAVAWGMDPGTFRKRRSGKQQGTDGTDAAGVALGIVALLAPVVLLPGLAWGAAGRLRPAWYPASWLAAARMIDGAPAPGAVLLLPWAADREPSWNHGEKLLDPWPRLLSRLVIWNDGMQVGNVKMAPDDPRARALNSVVSGGGPLTQALRSAGVRFVIDDADPPDGQIASRLPGCAVRVSEPGLVVCEISPG